MPTYTPQHVANFFLDRAEDEGIPLTQLKLMKLVYIAYGWYLAITGEKLFVENIQAWKHGPVIPSLYHEFKHFGSQPIDERATSLDWESSTITIPRIPPSDETATNVLSLVWDVYKRFTGPALVRKTHEQGTPWAHAYRDGQRDTVIDPATIGSHYKARLNEYIRAARAS